MNENFEYRFKSMAKLVLEDNSGRSYWQARILCALLELESLGVVLVQDGSQMRIGLEFNVLG